MPAPSKRRKPKAWARLQLVGPERDVHVIPINDLHRHEERRDCWCHPVMSQEPYQAAVVAHNSADGRELVERHGVN